MSSAAGPDLSSLARLAVDGNVDIRPALLRVQTDLFVRAPVRDRAATETFGALATGMLPLVDGETARSVAAQLVSCPDTPADVLKLIGDLGLAPLAAAPAPAEALRPSSERAELRAAQAEHLDPQAVLALLSLEDPDIDLTLAANRQVRFGGHALATLVARAREAPDLGAALLERDDLSAWDKAALYRHGEASRRAQIRAELTVRLLLRAPSVPRLKHLADESVLLGFAEDGNAADLLTYLGTCLGFPAPPDWDLASDLHQEFLTLSLVAAGVPVESCAQLLLMLDRAISGSVQTVLRLLGIARTTPQAVALHLLDVTCGPLRSTGPRGPAQTSVDGIRPRPISGQVGGRLDLTGREVSRPLPGREGSVPPGPRSRSTTGRGRT